MAEENRKLNMEEVCTILTATAPLGTTYCLHGKVEGNPIGALIYKVVRSEQNPHFCVVVATLSEEAAREELKTKI